MWFASMQVHDSCLHTMVCITLTTGPRPAEAFALIRRSLSLHTPPIIELGSSPARQDMRLHLRYSAIRSFVLLNFIIQVHAQASDAEKQWFFPALPSQNVSSATSGQTITLRWSSSVQDLFDNLSRFASCRFVDRRRRLLPVSAFNQW